MIEDANAAVEYAGCQTKHAEVAGLYEYWRQRIISFVAELEEEER